MQIKANAITHIFDKGGFMEFKALDQASAIFNQGEFVTIIGSTGSGKTTFIEHLNALLRPTSGQVEIDSHIIEPGKKRIRKVKEFRKKVGIVFQFAEYQLFEETIFKDIIFGPITMGMKKSDAVKNVKESIKMVGLSIDYLNRSPFQLSGGQKRRVALAGILSMDPDFLIFDEPTAGLDPEGIVQMYSIFKRLNRAGKTIIIVTHNLDHALMYSRRTILFKEGKVIADGSTTKILYDKKLLLENNLQLPKIVDLVLELESKGHKIGKIKSIEELAKKL